MLLAIREGGRLCKHTFQSVLACERHPAFAQLCAAGVGTTADEDAHHHDPSVNERSSAARSSVVKVEKGVKEKQMQKQKGGGWVEPNSELFVAWGMKSEECAKVFKCRYARVQEMDGVQDTLEWLLAELDLNERQVVHILVRYPYVLRHSISRTLKPWMQKLRDEGATTKDLAKMVRRFPIVLGLSSKFEPLQAYFQENLAVSRDVFLKTILKNPRLLSISIAGKLRMAVDYFLKLGMTRPQLGSMIVFAPSTLALSLRKVIIPTIERMKSIGLTREHIVKVVRGMPSLARCDPDKTILVKLSWLHDCVGLNYTEALEFFVKYPQLFIVSIKTWEENRLLYRSWGMEDDEYKAGFKQYPASFSLATKTLMQKFEFAWNVLGREPEEIFQRLRYFGSSYEQAMLRNAAFLLVHDIDISNRSLHTISVSSLKILAQGIAEPRIEAFESRWTKLNLQDKEHFVSALLANPVQSAWKLLDLYVQRTRVEIE